MITIYKLLNKTNTKVYIGQTTRTVKERFASGHGYVKQPHLHHAIQRYGAANFYYEIIAFCGTQEVADELERHFIQKYDAIEQGYNIALGGNAIGTMSAATRQKISQSMKGRKQSAAHKNNLSKVRKGVKKTPFTPEHKANMSAVRRKSDNPSFKAGHIDVAKLKEEYGSNQFTQAELAKKYGVSPATISRLLHDKQWVK